MDIELRPVTDDEFPAFARHIDRAFGHDITEEEIAVWRSAHSLESTIAAFDAGDIVGTAGAWPLEQTLPGLTSIPVGGLTAVSVSPTHRRRGVLTRMMTEHFDRCAARGEAVSILTASESIIYGRFGYGWATDRAGAIVETAHSAFDGPAADAGRIRLVDKDTATKVFPGVFEQYRRTRPGEISRPQGWWDWVLADHPSQRDGATALQFAIHESPDSHEPDGYVGYRLKGNWEHGNPRFDLIAADLVSASPETEAALFRYVLDVDLVETVRFPDRPLDDHLRRRLADPRRYRVASATDEVWVRLLDLPAALAARRYEGDGDVVIEVHDRFRPANDGRYRVGNAGCAKTSDEPDIAVPVDSLGAAYLGGVPFASLARAGRAEERRAGGLRRADALFHTAVSPYCSTGF